jgi:hypothetical protein
MADLRAMTSGLESNSMGSGAGGGVVVWFGWECVKVCLCCCCCCRCDELPGGWVGRRGGVMGDMGGGTGEVERELGPGPEPERGGLFVDIVRAGILFGLALSF